MGLVDEQPVPNPLVDKAFAELHSSRDVGREHLPEILGGSALPPVSKATRSLTTPKRRSKRRVASVDRDSLERAARLVAKKNLDEQDGMYYN